MTEPMVSFERRALVWLGAMLLYEGHTVSLSRTVDELFVHKKEKRRILLSVRDRIDLEKPRTVVETVATLEPTFPAAVVLLNRTQMDTRALHVVPVHSTREKWISEGRHYTLPTELLVPFGALDAWLKKLP